MARTARDRYEGALEYIREKIDRGLAQDIRRNIASGDSAGAEISLSGGGFWHAGTESQHWAIRALLLCQQAYLVGPGAHPIVRATNANAAARVQAHFRNRSEAQVQEAIKSYKVKTGVTRQKLATVAEHTHATEGDFDFATRTRQDDSLGANPVCFNAVRLWLFKAGFVSLRWLASDGYGLDANTCNQILGDGIEITPRALPRMPKGYMFNFHARKSPATCHWGISLGGGRAAGSNTTASENEGRTTVNFERGNSVYGVFPMAESYEVCRYKYRLTGEEIGDVVIRQIDPAAVQTFF